MDSLASSPLACIPAEILSEIVQHTDKVTQTCLYFTCKGFRGLVKPVQKNKICTETAKYGYLEVLQWARANGCPWNKWTCAYAAKDGHLEVLQWIRANGCPWNEDTCAYAAEGGHLKVLQWARANGCPWDRETCIIATRFGHLDVLQWARANGCPE